MSNRMKKCVTLLIWLCLSACTSQNPQTLLKTGDKPFRFDPRQVHELTVTKFDPQTGDRWFTILKNTSSGWKITSAPDGAPLQDRLANGPFIDHLMDALKDLQIDGPGPRGSLASMGLAPPWFALQWKTAHQKWELQIGSALRGGSHYFTLNGTDIWTGKGSALKMLELVQQFKDLRQLTWSTYSSDDVDEVLFHKKGKLIFYAQREGDVWTDKKHRPLQRNIPEFLEKLTTLKSEDLLEEKLPFSPNLFQIDLFDRFGHLSSLQIKSTHHELRGLNSSRSQAIFSLPLPVLHWLETIAQHP